MEWSKVFTLKHGGKNFWFDCHRQFLSIDYILRRNRDAFYKNQIEKDQPPHRLTGDEVWETVSSLPKITEEGSCKCDGYGVKHNWIKQRIFWELPYWKTNLIKHNLDVMHIQKNIFDNVFNTVMDIKSKIKDNAKARIDLKEYHKWRDLELQKLAKGKVMKPKAKFTLTME